MTEIEPGRVRSANALNSVATVGRRLLAVAIQRVPRWLWGLAAVVWALVLWNLSAREGGGGAKALWMSWIWNSAHVVAYAILGACCYLAARRSGSEAPLLAKASLGAPAWFAVLVTALYGVLDEWHQSHVPGRDCSGWDMGSDVLGACLAVALLAFLERRVPIVWSVVFAIGGVVTVTGATAQAGFFSG